nr:ribosomal protein S11 [Elakatothrix viridis]
MVKKKKTFKKKRRKIFRGVIHIQSGHHNTIITITNVRGDVVCWSSSGSCGFKGKRKATPFAAKKAAETALKKSKDFFMKECKILISGTGQGRETAIKQIVRTPVKVNVIREKTAIPHNGCRPPKRRSV